MADAVDVQSLFLQVDASVELLRRNLAAGEQPLSQFEQRAAKMTQSVEKSIGEMGKNFGAFSKLAESAAQQAQRSFNDSFTQIQKMAATAIQAPTIKGGGLNLGAAEARQAADAARQQAQALGLIERAARSAAAGEGVMTQETRLYLQAASAARIEAERHAAELVREAGALERLEIETRAAASGHQLLATGQRAVVVSAGQQRQATMMLGQQAQDFAVQVMSGQSVLIAFSQQIGQAAFAVQGMGGKLAAVGAFLGSGWGAAVIVATTVLVPLVGKMLEQNNALDDTVDKLKKDAEQTILSEKAHAIFTRTIEGQIDAQRRLNAELDKSVVTQRQQLLMKSYEAQQSVRTQRESRPGLVSSIAAQQRRVDLLNDQFANPGKYGLESDAVTAIGIAAGQAETKLQSMKDQLSELDKSIANGERAVREAQVPLIQSDVEASMDRKAAATKRYTIELGRLNQQLALGAGRTAVVPLAMPDGSFRNTTRRGIGREEYEREVRRITATRDAEYARAQDANSSTRSRQQVFDDFRRELSARGIQQAAGRTGYRSAKDQNEIFKAGESPLDGFSRVSRHQTWQALDPTRASHNDQDAYSAAQAAGLKGFRIVTESGGRKHYEWTGAGKKGEADAAGSETIARRAETAQNQILADQISYAEQVRQARRRLLDAQGRTADTAEEQDRLAREEVQADYEAQRTKIAAQLARKDLKPAEAAGLNTLNEQSRDQRLTNITTQRAIEKIAAGYDAASQDADSQIAMLRIQGDMATTLAERRRIALELLKLEQDQYERQLERTRDTSTDPEEVARAQSALRALPERQAAERAQTEQRYAGPMDQYRSQLQAATGDMNTALEGVAVNGLENLQNGLTGIISGTESVGSAFKRMASSIVADLARIAIEKLILSSIGGGGSFLSAFGLAGGGKVEGRAGGGKVSGPGTGTSDSILAMLGAKPIMLSNGESIVTAEATAKFWPVIDAMNKGKMKQFASGGLVSGLPALPTLSAPRLPAVGRQGYGSRGTAETLLVKVDKSPYFDVEVQRVAAPMSQMAAIGGSEMAQQELAERQAQVLS